MGNSESNSESNNSENQALSINNNLPNKKKLVPNENGELCSFTLPCVCWGLTVCHEYIACVLSSTSKENCVVYEISEKEMNLQPIAKLNAQDEFFRSSVCCFSPDYFYYKETSSSFENDNSNNSSYDHNYDNRCYFPRLLALGGKKQSNIRPIKIYNMMHNNNTTTKEEVASLEDHTATLTSCHFNPNAQELASTSLDKTVRIYSFEFHMSSASSPSSFAINKKNKQPITINFSSMCEYINHCQYHPSPEKSSLLCVVLNDKIVLCNSFTGDILRSISEDCNQIYWCCCWTANGKHLLVGGNNYNNLEIYDVEGKKNENDNHNHNSQEDAAATATTMTKQEYQLLQSIEHKSAVYSIAAHPLNSHIFAVASGSCDVTLYHRVAGEKICVYKRHSSTATQCAFQCYTGDFLVSTAYSTKDTLKVWLQDVADRAWRMRRIILLAREHSNDEKLASALSQYKILRTCTWFVSWFHHDDDK